VPSGVARRRYADTAPVTGPEVDKSAGEALRARLAQLPADARPLPSVAPYDELLSAPGADRPAAQAPRTGHGWDDTDVCLWRDEGRWGLTGPDGEIEVAGLGMFGWITARDTKGAQAAAAEAITALTGRAVTGWDRDEWSRSVYGPSSWYACLAPAHRQGREHVSPGSHRPGYRDV
jgi:hypothetical protein